MRTITTIEEYNSLKAKLTANNQAIKDYCRINKTNGIPVEISNSFPFAAEVNNDLRSAIEEFEFRINPPEKYFLYVDTARNIVTTWTGQKLGNITELGKTFRSNMSDDRQYIKFTGVNGFKYSGFYFRSSGDYARVKKLKS